MKYLYILICCMLFISTDIFSADANPTSEIGSMTIDGGSSHLAYMTGFEMNLKKTKGFVNKIRAGVYQIRNESPENQGYFAWNVSQVTLKESWWNFYASSGFGVLNEVKNGDDSQVGGTMLELGCNAFNKLPIGIGMKLFPVDNRGDKVFLYGMISFSLP